jgi:hypothetical protein
MNVICIGANNLQRTNTARNIKWLNFTMVLKI